MKLVAICPEMMKIIALKFKKNYCIFFTRLNLQGKVKNKFVMKFVAF